MSDLDTLKTALEPLLEAIGELNPDDEGSKKILDEKFPIGGEALTRVRDLLRRGVEAGWVCDREAGGVRFSRVLKAASDAELSIDAVHMDAAGPGHTHPQGEFDLCFTVSGAPTFDGHPEGWTVYPANSWHVPSVEGGVMDILYFLPGGAIKFEPNPNA